MVRREQHTSAEIRAEVHRLLNQTTYWPSALEVPLPVPTERNPEKGGANWDMHFRHATGFQIEIGLALLQVKMRWDLKG